MTLLHLLPIPLLLSVTLVTEVTPWTIDLPEVRRFYFEKYSKPDDHKELDYNKNETYFDNINSDSPHNTDVHNQHQEHVNIHNLNNMYNVHAVKQEDLKNNVYANAYHHKMYMVRKVSHGVLANGTAYLEGLRLAIERYIEVLENCSRIRLQLESPAKPPQPLSIGNFTGMREFQEMCSKATEKSEHVRRLAGLALDATRRLQDVAFIAKYNKDASMEENELLLRLAWFLDKLAHLTGYDPKPEDFMPIEKVFSTPPPLYTANPLNVTDELKARILQCLQEKSNIPATERCSFPNPPPTLYQIINMLPKDNRTGFQISSLIPLQIINITRNPRKSSDAPKNVDQEILVATDTLRSFAPNLTPRSVKKRSVTDEANPLVKYLKYYAKYKSWENSNPMKKGSDDEFSNIDVDNHLAPRIIKKRDLTVINSPKYRIPDNPMPDLSEYVKSKPGVHYVKDIKIEDQIKTAFDKIYSKKLLPTQKFKDLKKIFRMKRSSYYGNVIRPQIPADPQENISYYVKNKEGTNNNADLVQAALLRASLEAAFQRGNINVVHKYGANYNPAIPAPFYAGIIRSASDI